MNAAPAIGAFRLPPPAPRRRARASGRRRHPHRTGRDASHGKLTRLFGTNHQRVPPRVAVEGGAELGAAAAAFDRDASKACASGVARVRGAFARPARIVRSVGRRGDASVVILADEHPPASPHPSRRVPPDAREPEELEGRVRGGSSILAGDEEARLARRFAMHDEHRVGPQRAGRRARSRRRPFASPDGADVTARGALAPSSAHALDDVAAARPARSSVADGHGEVPRRVFIGREARLGRGLRAHGCVDRGNEPTAGDMNRLRCFLGLAVMVRCRRGRNLRALASAPAALAETARDGTLRHGSVRRPRRSRRGSRRQRRSRRPVQARPQARPRRRG